MLRKIIAGALALALLTSPALVVAQETKGTQPLSIAKGGTGGMTVTPQGRITLTSNTPVMTVSVAGASTVYYTPYAGNMVPLYDGTSWLPNTVAQLSISLGSNWAANSNFDGFIGKDGSTVRFCTGPAWTSSTARGSGAGTTELTVLNGIRLNAVSMTCRYNNTTTFTCAAQRCTYVGTIHTGASTGIVNYQFGGVAAGCTAGDFGVWNAFNRRPVPTTVSDSTDTWSYTSVGAAAWRAANASNSCRVSAVRGADEDGIIATYNAYGGDGTSAVGAVGVGLNSTTAFAPPCCTTVNITGSTHQSLIGSYVGLMGLGYNYVQAIEYNSSITNAVTFIGDFGTVYTQTGLSVVLWQ